MSNFDACLRIVFGHEGGWANHPDDPGGATQMGITHGTLAAWRGEPVTADDVRTLTRREATEIYRAQYWNAVHGDELPPGVDLCLFDMGVNAGPGQAVKLAQPLVEVRVDGGMGPVTLGAINDADPVRLIEAYTSARLDFYQSLRNWDTFKNGWTRRAQETRDAAIRMASRKPEPPVAQAPVTLIERLMAWWRSAITNRR